MKKIFPFLIALLLIASCGNDDDSSSNTDLTELAVGVYYINGNQDDGIITVNKINNNSVSIAFQNIEPSSVYNSNFAFTDVNLNSETSFTLNQITIHADPCNGILNLSGTGTVSQTAISIFINQEITSDPNSQSPVPCPSNPSVNFSATRQ